MEVISNVMIYWYISMGLLIGFVYGLLMKKEGAPMKWNIFWGMAAAVIMGVIGVFNGLSDGIWFSFIATIAFLFLVNVFHNHHEEDVLGEISHPARVVYKKRKSA